MKLAWVTDPHLNFVGSAKTMLFAARVAEQSDACIITGDIAEADSLVQLLGLFKRTYGKPVYFVLGNHDFYGSDFSTVARAVFKEFGCDYLDQGAVFDLAPGVQLCGVDGWYDARLGLPEVSRVELNDWTQIEDLAGLGASTRIEALRMIGDHFQGRAAYVLARTTAKRIIFATHVPPFAESSVYNGKQSDANYLPWFTNKALGDALLKWATANPKRELTVLCGHTHGRALYRPLPNLTVKTGFADYGAPCVEAVIDLSVAS